MTKSCRVFISSTYMDNKERRMTAEDAILRAEMVPVGMERFAAVSQPPLKECMELVQTCDLYVGIIAWRYGWIPEGKEKAITELEYEAAVAAGLDRLLFVIDETIPVVMKDVIDPGPGAYEKQAKLMKFRDRVKKDGTPAIFTEKSLGTVVLDSLTKWSNRSKPTKKEKGHSQELKRQIERYLQKITSRYETISLSGFETKVRVPIRLDELYVPLDAVVDVSGEDNEDVSNRKGVEKVIGRHSNVRVPLAEAFQCAASYGDRKGIVILGDPGSGKTTQLKRILLAAVQEGSEKLGLNGDFIPVFLPLRNLLDTSQGLDAFIESELNDPLLDMPKNFARNLVDRGRLLLLFDGLEEVANEKDRKQVAGWINRALGYSPDCRLVVTCRYAGYGKTTRLSANFLEMHLRPLDRAQADAFIHNWFRIVETSMASDKAQAKGEANKEAKELIARLQESEIRTSRVFELTRNPLLLTTICLVHRDRGKLPRHRAKLYDECVNILLERWREAKKLPVSVPAESARSVLQPIAYFLHNQENRTRATAEELSSVIEPVLDKVKIANRTPKQFLNSIRDESGLLTGWSTDSYGFMHLGFQEYLAAREIRSRSFEDEKVLEALAGKFGQSWWREVILLTVALEDPPLFEKLMRFVIEQPAFGDHPGLVESCLEDAVQILMDPFIELMQKAPGKKKEFWQRQLQALRILEARAPAALENFRDQLLEHPLPEIATRFAKPETVSESKVAKRGDYELVLIPGGEFMMGSPEDEEDRSGDEGPVHKVDIAAFYLGRYPVTNEQYGVYLKENSNVDEPEFWADRQYNQNRQPVVGVSWEDAGRYAEWAGLRLPSEAEWEYACRAGTTTRYYTGNREKNLYRARWYYGNSESRLHLVGEKEANVFGLYDMQGNILEWVEDDWHENYDGVPSNSQAWLDNPRGARRVVRGGSWYLSVRGCRSACRFWFHSAIRDSGPGFRLACTC